MANTPTHDLMYTKLKVRYPAIASLGDGLQAYETEYNGGAAFGTAWYARYGGAAVHWGDRAQAFWTAWDPAIGG